MDSTFVITDWQGMPKNFLHVHSADLLVEIKRLLELLSRRNITTRLATEQEFALRDLSSNHALIEKRRREFIDAVRKKPTRWKQELIADFTPGEILMFDIVSYDHRTAPHMIQNFGKSTAGNGYYDGQLHYELRQNHEPLIESVEFNHRLSEILLEKAQLYGLFVQRACPPIFHYNISFHNKDGNLLDPKHPHFKTWGRALAEGIVYSAQKSEAWHEQNFGVNADEVYDIGPSRGNAVRIVNGRIELRPSNYSDEGAARFSHQSSLEANVIIALAGALFGLQNADKSEVTRGVIKYKPVVQVITDHEEVRLLELLLSSAMIEGDKIRIHARDVADNCASLIARKFGVQQLSKDVIVKLFNNAEILDEGILLFPENEYGINGEKRRVEGIKIVRTEECIIIPNQRTNISYDRTAVLVNNRAMRFLSPECRSVIARAAAKTPPIKGTDTPWKDLQNQFTAIDTANGQGKPPSTAAATKHPLFSFLRRGKNN